MRFLLGTYLRSSAIQLEHSRLGTNVIEELGPKMHQWGGRGRRPQMG
jgi:hypothetical protein